MGRGLIGVEQCVRSEEAGLRKYLVLSEEWMLVVAENVIEGESKVEYRKRMEKAFDGEETSWEVLQGGERSCRWKVVAAVERWVLGQERVCVCGSGECFEDKVLLSSGNKLVRE